MKVTRVGTATVLGPYESHPERRDHRPVTLLLVDLRGPLRCTPAGSSYVSTPMCFARRDFARRLRACDGLTGKIGRVIRHGQPAGSPTANTSRLVIGRDRGLGRSGGRSFYAVNTEPIPGRHGAWPTLSRLRTASETNEEHHAPLNVPCQPRDPARRTRDRA